MRDGLPAAANLAIAAARGGLRRLPAGVGIHTGVEHENVHIAAAGEHVIEPTEANVVGPAVAADDPHAAADERIGHGQQLTSLRNMHVTEP